MKLKLASRINQVFGVFEQSHPPRHTARARYWRWGAVAADGEQIIMGWDMASNCPFLYRQQSNPSSEDLSMSKAVDSWRYSRVALPKNREANVRRTYMEKVSSTLHRRHRDRSASTAAEADEYA